MFAKCDRLGLCSREKDCWCDLTLKVTPEAVQMSVTILSATVLLKTTLI